MHWLLDHPDQSALVVVRLILIRVRITGRIK